MNLTAIRQGIQTNLKTINGLRCYDVWPDQLNCPAAIVRPVQGDFHQTAGDDPRILFEVTMLVAPIEQGFVRGQNKLDAYLGESGADSVKAAIEADSTLNGTVEDVIVRRWRDYGPMEVAGIGEYIGVKFDLEVVT